MGDCVEENALGGLCNIISCSTVLEWVLSTFDTVKNLISDAKLGVIYLLRGGQLNILYINNYDMFNDYT